MSLDMKTAARVAVQHIHEMYEDLNISNVLLEEVERGDSGDWMVTVGFDRPRSRRNILEGIGADLLLERVYKVVRIDSETGEPTSMTMRMVP